MANSKKRKASRQPATAPAASDVRSQDEEVAPVKSAASESKAKTAGKGSGDKGKKEAVVKSKARAKDPKKANKKPNIFRRFIEYIKQVRLEIKRTTWPTKNEVLNMTIIVIVALLFFGIFIFVINFIMVTLLELYGTLAPDAAASAALDPSALTGLDSGSADLTSGTDASAVADSGTDPNEAASGSGGE